MSLDVGVGETATVGGQRSLRLVVLPASSPRRARAARAGRAKRLGLGGALAPAGDAGPTDRVLARAFWRRDALGEPFVAPVVPLLSSFRVRRT